MATAVQQWPSVLPRPQQSGYTLEVRDTKLRSDTESGSAIVRNRFTKEEATYQEKYLMTGDEFTIFLSWYKNKIENGVAWFQKEIQDGGDILVVDARFVGVYKASLAGPNTWSVSFKLEVHDRPIMEEDYLDAVVYYGPTDLAFVSDSLYALIHEGLPGYCRWYS